MIKLRRRLYNFTKIVKTLKLMKKKIEEQNLKREIYFFNKKMKIIHFQVLIMIKINDINEIIFILFCLI
jgi:hypothetical protein